MSINSLTNDLRHDVIKTHIGINQSQPGVIVRSSWPTYSEFHRVCTFIWLQVMFVCFGGSLFCFIKTGDLFYIGNFT